MKKTLAITLYDRTVEVIDAVFNGLRLPGNTPDIVAVCYDRAPKHAMEAVKRHCMEMGIELRESVLTDAIQGPRCPSKAWNTVLATVYDQKNVFCMSSEMILAPHSIGMAYQLAQVAPEYLIVGRAEHCGQSYAYTRQHKDISMKTRTITSSFTPHPLGFSWLLPMKAFQDIEGFDEVYQDGLCYEDDDFVLRMWNHGVNFMFCDDIMGFHLEHKRDHLKDGDGRVTINEKIFETRWGDLNILKDHKIKMVGYQAEVGLAFWVHEGMPDKERDDVIKATYIAQKMYGQYEDWRAIPVTFEQVMDA